MSKPTNITWHETSISKKFGVKKMVTEAVYSGLRDSQDRENQLSQMLYRTNCSVRGSMNMSSMVIIFATV
jgi:hypothetical protein